MVPPARPVVKRSASGPAAEVLRAEAGILRRARHPGVVALVDAAEDDGTITVTTAAPAGRPIEELDVTGSEIAAVMAVLVTTIADLHDIGIAFGGRFDGCVYLDGKGRPVLHDFEHAATIDGRPREWAESAEARRDVVALGRFGVSLLGPATSTARRRSVGKGIDAARAALALAAEGDGRRQLRARVLAERLVEAMPDARLPRPDAPAALAADDVFVEAAETAVHHDAPAPPVAAAPRRRRFAPHRPALLWVALTTGGLAFAFAAFAFAARPTPAARSPHHHSPSRAGANAAASTRMPGDPGVRFENGIVVRGDQRYAVGRAGDVLAIGRWTCGAVETVALLRPADGRVWVFDRWPAPAAPASPRLVGVVPTGNALSARPAGDGARCDELVVGRPGRVAIALQAWSRA